MNKPKSRTKSEYEEGATAARRFDDTLRRVIAVPKEEIQKRHQEWEKKRKGK